MVNCCPLNPDTTLLFVTDTHLGAGTTGYQMQPRVPHLLQPAFEAIRRLVRERHVDYVIHGGDLTELGTPQQIEQGVQLLKDLGAPTAMCLGNHDLTTPESADTWRTGLTTAGVQLADCVITAGGWDVLLLNTHYALEARLRLFWSHQQRGVESLTPAQLAWLDAELARRPDRPAVVVTHVPPDPLPPRLTGRPAPIHTADAAYAGGLEAVLSRYRRVKLLLTGHNHVNCATPHPGRLHLSTSATLEPPFEVRLIRLRASSLQVETVPLLPLTGEVQWLPQQAWISGQAEDRTVELAW